MASSFLDRVKGPVASCQVVRTLLLPILEQVVADGGELERCTALEHEDGEVVRDCQELLQVASGLLGNGGEGLASMTHFHHGHARAIVVHEGVCCLLEDRLGQAAGARRKVIYGFTEFDHSCKVERNLDLFKLVLI